MTHSLISAAYSSLKLKNKLNFLYQLQKCMLNNNIQYKVDFQIYQIIYKYKTVTVRI